MRVTRIAIARGLKTLLCIGGVLGAAAIGLLAEVAAGAQGSATFKSGAGPGWPRTLRPSDFVKRVDNPWFPLRPGSVYRYRGIKEHTPMVDVVHVTHRRKMILGVRATVVHDVVYVHGRPEEVTNDWYAQDRHGNVWYFGERTKELNRHGKVISREGSFRAGRHGARVGLFIPRHPRVGTHGRQEFYRGHAEDHFRVVRAPCPGLGALRLHPPRPADQGVDPARAGRHRQQVLRPRHRHGPRDRGQGPGGETPPDLLQAGLITGRLSCTDHLASLPTPRRGAGVVERGGLENRCGP